MLKDVETHSQTDQIPVSRYVYQAYGLTIASELELPELTLVNSNADIDVVLRFGSIEPTEDIKNSYRLIKPVEDGILLYWHDVGIFLVKNGQEIIIDPIPDVEQRVLRLFTLGTTMAMLLHQRQESTVLHASAVVIDGYAVGFVGDKGAGKSTISASLNKLGYPLLSDDVLAISNTPNGLMAMQGFPHFKLWPDTIASLGHSVEELPKLRPELDKRGVRLLEGFAQEPAPVTHIFVLDQGPNIEITPILPKDAWKELMPHWYGARFGEGIIRHLGLAAHFQQCVELANSLSICHLRRPRDLEALNHVAEIVAKFTSSR